MVILTSFPPPTEGIHVEQPNTSAHVGNTRFGTGTLYIAESRLSWMGSSGRGFSLEYPAISLHAVSRDRRVHPDECLYMMVDADLRTSSNELGGGETSPSTPTVQMLEDDEPKEDEDGQESDITEIIFVPEDKGVLDALFHAMSECQALHPDPENEDTNGSDEDDEGDEYGENEGPFQGLTSGLNGSATTNDDVNNSGSRMVHDGVANIPMDTSQFEDADPQP